MSHAVAPLRGLFLEGIVVSVLSPETALFFLASLPQFVDPGRAVWSQVLAFGVVFALLGVASDRLYALAAGWAGHALVRTLVRSAWRPAASSSVSVQQPP